MNLYDCHGGPGTTEPECGACITCLHRVIEQKDERIKRLEEMYESKPEEHLEFLNSNVFGLLKRELNAANQRIKRLEEALEGTLKWIVDLADSGDAGFWNPEEQSVIMQARAALEKEAKP